MNKEKATIQNEYIGINCMVSTEEFPKQFTPLFVYPCMVRVTRNVRRV
jgi:hypothetical protein